MMKQSRPRVRFVVLVVLAAAALGSAHAGQPAETVLLVATPELGGNYARTILIATRVTQGRHVGVILNRPTRTSLAAVFPEHAPSKKIVDTLHLGGPVALDAVFALVRTKESPGEGSVQLAPDLFLATTGTVIDRLIEQAPDRARFYAGVVVWEPGELAAEIARGFWLVQPADTDLVFRTSSEGLWEELVRRSQALTASLPLGDSKATNSTMRTGG
jgi:putative transcriptional regulator